jgi:hypothetical protein
MSLTDVSFATRSVETVAPCSATCDQATPLVVRRLSSANRLSGAGLRAPLLRNAVTDAVLCVVLVMKVAI